MNADCCKFCTYITEPYFVPLETSDGDVQFCRRYSCSYWHSRRYGGYKNAMGTTKPSAASCSNFSKNHEEYLNYLTKQLVRGYY